MKKGTKKSETAQSYCLVDKLQIRPVTMSIEDFKNDILLACYIKNQLINKTVILQQEITISVLGDLQKFQIIHLSSISKQGELNKVGPKTVIQIVDIKQTIQQQDIKDQKIELFGLDEQLTEIQFTIRNSVFNKGKLHQLGLNRIKALLILGLSGMGKSSVVKYICNSMRNEAKFKVYQSFNILSKYVSGSEQLLKKIFAEARKQQPYVIVFEDLHLLFSKKKPQNETILSALLTQIQNIQQKQQIIVVGTSNLERQLDHNIKRSGRFQKQIIIELPKHKTREAIIKGFVAKIPNKMQQSDVKEINLRLNGFSIGQIKQIIRQSYLLDTAGQLKKAHVLFVLKNFRPAGVKQILSQVPQTKWSDIGGYEQVKLEIRKVVEWPLQHPEAYKRLGIQPLKGILLYGPPGCSKTMMAKAIATQSKLNFLSVKGSQLFSKYVGQSQKAVRNLFKRARSCSPCIIFFDEIDAIATQRSANTEVSERVLIQLLTQMDGIQSLKEVTIVAATNRPQVLDQALMRPGRFDHLIYLPPPDQQARKQIFKINLSKMAVKTDLDVLSHKLAELTPNYTGAEICLICRQGALKALSQNLEADTIDEKHFFQAQTKINPRLTSQSIDQYRRFKDNIRLFG